MDYLIFILWFSFVWGCLCVVNERTSSTVAKLPPGPVGLPIIGSLFKTGNNLWHESLAKLANIHGPIMSLKLGSSTIVVVSSSTIAKQILQKYDQVFASRTVPDALRASNHNESSIMWLPSSSHHWRTVRKISNSHMLSSHRLEANQGLRHQKMKDLIAYVRESSQAGRSVDIGEAAFTTVLNLISNIMFSLDLAKINSKSAFEFKALVRGVMEEAGRPNLADIFPILSPFDPQGVRHRMESLLGKLDEFFDRMIEQRLQSRISEDTPCKNDLLDTLLDDGKEKGSKLTRAEIKALLKDILIQGTDTSSSTWEWAMAELLHNPDKMAKMQSELRKKIVNEHVHESDFGKLPYLQAMWKETLRMHPPIPLLFHRAEAETEICGYTVPKHAQVLVNVWAIGRDPNVWENPNSFIPERFLGSKSVVDFKGRDFELIPFGAGRRICPGLSLAEKVAHLNLASLLKSFDWKLEGEMKAEDMNMMENSGFAIRKDVPLLAIPKVCE